MKQKDVSTRSQEPAASAPRRRFRLMKLEERIAPKRGGNTKHCGGSGTTTGAGSSSVSY